MSGSETLLAIDDLEVTYGKVSALRGVSFDVDQGDFVAIIGPNGAGKSTLSDAIAGFVDYDGSIEYLDEEVRDRMVASSVDIMRQQNRTIGERIGTLTDRYLTKGARTMVRDGLIYCTEKRNLFGEMSVQKNLQLGTYQRKGNVSQRMDFVYDLFPVLQERRDQLAQTLSGGEQQQLAIGRALMSNPRMLLLDEPTLGLSPRVREDIANALTQIQQDGVTVVLCEQNVTFAMDLADQVYLMENGLFARQGNPETLRGDEYIQSVYLGE
ncbi:ABC transporter ATP-binding protein [Halorientalis salina]|uniref:ABC transporter ATP-binding protein n=1 Tax=Halorientalis salina TaxID=2932266 RepID=UPI0010AC1DDD|nr:ABC transporter ATP-binding protein [Halorientalis salina]